MKKILSLGLLVLLCVTVFVGCGEASKEEMKYSAPHNVKVKLDDTEENIIKIDNLVKGDSTVIEEYETKGEVSFAGFTFDDASYAFRDGMISYLSYICSDSENVDADKEKLINRLSEIYGEPKDSNSGEWLVKLASGEAFTISVEAVSDSYKGHAYSYVSVNVKNKRWYNIDKDEKIDTSQSKIKNVHSIYDNNIHPKNGVISLKQYEKLEDGMSLEQVMTILDADYDKEANADGYSDYSWHQEKYSSVVLVSLSFHNDKLYFKFQSGLE